MELHTEDWDQDGVILAIRGDVDTYAAGQLQREWQLRTSAGRTRVVLDLSGVRFGCSTFLTVMLQCKRATAGAGGQLVLLKP
jgi:anti-anti-sigma factor